MTSICEYSPHMTYIIIVRAYIDTQMDPTHGLPPYMSMISYMLCTCLEIVYTCSKLPKLDHMLCHTSDTLIFIWPFDLYITSEVILVNLCMSSEWTPAIISCRCLLFTILTANSNKPLHSRDRHPLWFTTKVGQWCQIRRTRSSKYKYV